MKRLSFSFKFAAPAFYLLGFGILSAYYYNYFTVTPVIYPEFHSTFLNMLYSGDGSLLYDAVSKTFNANIFEFGHYRPRALAFFVHWLDSNGIVWLSQKIPAWGLRLPGMFLATIILVYYAYKVLGFGARTAAERGFSFLAASALLFVPAFQNSSYIILRSGKILSPALSVFLLYVFLSRDGGLAVHKPIDFLRLLLFSFFLFVLSTGDEQIFAVCVFLTFFSIFTSTMLKRMDERTIIFGFTVVMYLIYVKYAGKSLFSAFTPGGIDFKHPHQFSDVLTLNMFYMIPSTLNVVYENILGCFKNAFQVIVAAVIATYAFLSSEKEQKVFSLVLIFFAVLLFLACCTAHPYIIYYQIWHEAVYGLTFMALLYIAFFNLVLPGIAQKAPSAAQAVIKCLNSMETFIKQAETSKWRFKIMVGCFIMTFAAGGALLFPPVQNLVLRFGEFYVGRPLNYPDLWRELFIELGKIGVVIHFILLYGLMIYKLYPRALIVSETSRFRFIGIVTFLVTAFAVCGAILLPAVQDLVIRFSEFYLQRRIHHPDWHELFGKFGKIGLVMNLILLYWFIVDNFFPRPVIAYTRKYFFTAAAVFIVWVTIGHFLASSRYQRHFFDPGPGGLHESAPISASSLRFMEILNQYGIKDFIMPY